ncbi:MAG: hypothetical protein IKR68_03165 [Lachnospiraceae bacterium]|nr:hypothetical protein [Lachnospiraceae bacterium]
MENYDAYEAAAAGITGGMTIVYLVVLVALIVAMWKLFVKADEPGWKSIIPFLNTYTLFKIAWGNGWLFLLGFVPVVNIVVSFILMWKLCKAFDKGVGFFVLMIFLAPIAWLILGFDSSEYMGPQ